MNVFPPGDSPASTNTQGLPNQVPPPSVSPSIEGKLGAAAVKKDIPDDVAPIFEKVKTAISARYQNPADSDAIAGRVVQFLNSKLSKESAARVAELKSYIEKMNVADPQLLNTIDAVLHEEIHQAIQNRDTTVAKFFAEKFSNEFKEILLSKDAEGNTPFHHAANEGKTTVLMLFADHFPELFKEAMLIRNNKGETPVHLAIDNTRILNLMLEKAPVELKTALLIKDAHGHAPIHQAVYCDLIGSVAWLAKNTKEQLSAGMILKDNEGHTAVHMAISLQSNHLFLFLASNVPDGVNEALVAQDLKGNTPLHRTAGDSKETLLAYLELLKQMPNFSKAMRILNNEGYSVLAQLKMLRDRGCKDITQQVKGDKALANETKEIFQRRAAAHALHIEGHSSLARRANKDIQSAKLEGHFSEQWFNMMGKDFSDFVQTYPMLDPSQILLFQQVFELGANSKNISLAEKYKKIQAGEPVVINTGFVGHAVTVLFWGDQIVICNRGAAARKPIEVFHFDRTKLEIKDIKAIENLRDKGTRADYQNLLFEQLPKKLEFIETPLDKELMKDNPLPNQTVGNCSFVSPVTAMYALLILDEMKNWNIDTNAPNKIEFDNIKRKAIVTYQTWLGFQQMKVLERLMVPVWDKNSTFKPDHQLILEALRKAYLLPLPLQSRVVLEQLAEAYIGTLDFSDRLKVRADLGFRAFQRNLKAVAS